MAANDVQIAIELIDKFGKPLSNLSKGLDDANKKVNSFNGAFNRANKDPYASQSRSLAQLKTNVERYKKAAENSFRLDHVRKYNILIGETEKRIKDIEDAASTCGEKTEGIFDKLQKNLGISKGMIGIGALSVGIKKAFDFSTESVMAAAQIERYNVTLKTMLGSTDAARDRMQEYFDIAKKTPFDMPQVVEAGNRLQALGKYSRENVTMLGDLAAASGKPMEQAVNAYSKLITGEKGMAMNMFRDLLITTDDWVKATGKGVSKSGELLATTKELADALPKIMKSKGYFGLMANQAATTEGKIANLNDSLFQLKVAVGDRLKPAYDSFITGTTKIIESMTKWVEIPIEQKIAKEKIELNLLVESLIENNDKQEVRKSLIDELQQKYPDFLKNIDLEKSSTEDLRKELEKVNGEYDKKIRKAAYQRQLDAIQAQVDSDIDDYQKYHQSVLAEKRATEISKEMERIVGNRHHKYQNGLGEVISYDEDRNLIVDDFGHVPIKNLLSEEIIKLRDLIAEYAAAKDLITSPLLSSSKSGAKDAWEKVEKGKKKMQMLKLLYGISESGNTEPDGPPLPPDDFFKPKSTNTDDLENGAETIASGGKGVKNFYITIGSLLGENTNIFQSSKDSPETAGDFLERLSHALQDVVNDVNYAAG
ncbi:MAG: hypothetical protein LBE11_03155 [Prevotellaceae bacterium]|jgi:hypothetical protein|nr:hypothetical protein [Prevotellaceae bacterium]